MAPGVSVWRRSVAWCTEGLSGPSYHCLHGLRLPAEGCAGEIRRKMVLAIEAVADAGVQIEFYLPCGYLNRATKLAELLFIEFEDHLPRGVTLIPGSGGVFEVWFNGEQVFSKKELGRFPEAREIEGALGPKVFGE